MDRKEIIQTVIGWMFNDVAISQPLYSPQIKSEKDGEKYSDTLPLIYIWNEKKKTGSFSVSINGPIVGEALEHLMPRSDPSFALTRDEIMEIVREVAIKSILNTCEKVGALPSIVFSKTEYQNTHSH